MNGFISLETDVLIVGAGAAGLMCAIEAGKRGRNVVVVEHNRRPAEKVRISGGGRCNFTNTQTSPANYISRNPRFCISALSRYAPDDFVALVRKHNIAFHEKKLGQLFCDGSSQQVVNMLLAECRTANVQILLNTTVQSVSQQGGGFYLQTSGGEISASSMVIASGGLSIPKMGATGIGYQVARQFGMNIVPTDAALVPFTLPERELKTWQALAGVSVDAAVSCGKQEFREGILFTHRGLSGPAMLQISLYWKAGEVLHVNLAPDDSITSTLARSKAAYPAQEPVGVLSEHLPKRLAQVLVAIHAPEGSAKHLGALSNSDLDRLARAVTDWHVSPNGTEGYRTAEVTLGGVDTAGLSSKTMECREVPGLYFIGEVVDVTGQLGGFNFQWAWASGFVAGQYV